MLAEGDISWRKNMQTLVASPTMEVEFIACFKASNRIWLQNFVTRLRILGGVERLLKIHCDN